MSLTQICQLDAVSQSDLHKVSDRQLLPFYHLTRVIHVLKPCLRSMDLKKWWTQNLWNKRKEVTAIRNWCGEAFWEIGRPKFKLNVVCVERFAILPNIMINFYKTLSCFNWPQFMIDGKFFGCTYLGLEKRGPDVSFIPIPVELKINFIRTVSIYAIIMKINKLGQYNKESRKFGWVVKFR